MTTAHTGVVVSEAKDKKEIPYQNVMFEMRGEKVIVPEGMSWEKLAKWVDLRRTEDERSVAINELIETFPLDGAIALVRALSEKFGWVDSVATPTFWGPKPPEMIGVEVAPGKTIQVPWGRFKIPDVDGWIASGVTRKDGRTIFQLLGEVKFKHKERISELAALAREMVRKNSIYKGKAIRVSFPGTPKNRSEEAEQWDPQNHAPRFMDLSNVNEKELIFPEDVERIVRTTLYNPIEHTQQCRDYQIPLKRGVLLEGPYGTGKTLTANVMAKKCETNGWTFIYLESVKQLKQALQFATAYSPSMIFAEDVDSVIQAEERDEAMNEILNTIDGVEGKHVEVITVLTTNHVERIHPAMLRPGRLDTVISVRYPDKGAVEALIRLYGRNLISSKENLSKLGEKLGDKVTPAIIREVVERSKLSAVGRLKPTEKMTLVAVDLETAADSMLTHLELLKPKEIKTEHPFAVLGDAVGKQIGTAIVEEQTKAKINGRAQATA